MSSLYELKIQGANVRRFIKYLYKRGIYFDSINYVGNDVIVRVNRINYKRIMDVRTIYSINIVRLYGFSKYLYLFKKYIVFIGFVIFSCFFIVFLSNVIFDVEVIHSSSNIRSLLYDELSKYGIKKYQFMKSFDEAERIKKLILSNNKDVLEWIEIERSGSKYKVRVEERKLNVVADDEEYRHIVAKKEGIITKINASSGEISKKIGDLVKKGDILISGYIHKGEDIKNTVVAKGSVYAEVWYKVKIDMPFTYYEERKTGNSKKRLAFNFFNNRYTIDFNPYDNKSINSFTLFKSLILPISVSIDKEEELIIYDEVYTYEEAIDKAIDLAYDKFRQQLDKSSTIIYQKKLKTEVKDSTIELTMFYKVEEDITDYFNIEKMKVE